jgi:hypothetical protein
VSTDNRYYFGTVSLYHEANFIKLLTISLKYVESTNMLSIRGIAFWHFEHKL